MKILRFFWLPFVLVSAALAQSTSSLSFMTPRDLLQNDSLSNISLRNSGSADATVYGLYVNQLAYVTPGDTCDHATPIYLSNTNTTVGSVVAPTQINAGKSGAIGKNYLYNMIYTANYYVYVNLGGAGCAIPGCTWGSDSTIYNWCIYLGVIGPASTTSGYTSTVPPAAAAASSPGQYNYNLVSSYVTLGPISCNDQTLSCNVATPQTQSFL